jgi:hypothetical protein
MTATELKQQPKIPPASDAAIQNAPYQKPALPLKAGL